MEQWIKKLSGTVIASLLALTLSSKAYAASPEAVSDERPGTLIEEHNTAPVSNVKADAKASAAENVKPAAEAAKPAPAEDAKPAAAEAAIPAPAEDAKPAAAEAAKSAPAEDAKPAVAEVAKSAPVEDAKPAVAEAAKPAAAEDAKQVVAEAAKPAAAEDAKPVVAEAAKSAPAEDTKPAVAEAAKSAPAEDAKPAVAEAAKSAPAEDAKPVVAEAAKSAPAEDAKPVVIENTKRVVTEDVKNTAGLSDITTPISLQKSAGEEPVRNSPEPDPSDVVTIGSIESNGEVISSSGVTIVGKITSSGDVKIKGTGIMLINNLSVNGTPVTSYKDGSINTDTIEHFFLQPLTGQNGSVAVFLNENSGTAAATDGTSSAGTYVLINGRTADGIVKGILNEQYVIPDNINLIMPSGTSIELTSPEINENNTDDVAAYVGACIAGTDSESYYKATPVNVIYGQKSIVTSCLTVPENSSLTVSKGASVNLKGKVLDEGLVAKNGYKDAYVQTPVLDIKGTLSEGKDGGGAITGNGIVVLSGNNLSDTNLNHPSIVPKVSIGPDVFRIYELSHAISYNKQHFELSRYVDTRDYLDHSSLIFQPKGEQHPEADSRDCFGNLIFTEFAFSVSKGKTDNLGGGEYDSTASFKDYSIFHWWIINNDQGGGGEITMTSTSSTGTGILGGKNAGAISMNLKVTDEKSYYNLSAYIEGKQIFKLNSKVLVRFDYPVPTAAGQLFVVFRNKDDSLTAFPARYDAITGELVFSGDKLGNFVVVSTDYNGKLYTKEFYDHLETFESVRNLKYGL